MSEIGKRIRDIRISAAMSQKVFAKALGVHQGHISKIETSAALPSDQLIRFICKTFIVNYTWLHDGRGAREPEWAEEIVKDLAELGNLSSEDRRLVVIFRLLLQKYKEYRNVIACLGENICILGDPDIQPGDPTVIMLVKKILRRLESEQA